MMKKPIPSDPRIDRELDGIFTPGIQRAIFARILFKILFNKTPSRQYTLSFSSRSHDYEPNSDVSKFRWFGSRLETTVPIEVSTQQMHRLKAYSHKPHSGGRFVSLAPMHFARSSVENWRSGFGSPFLWTPARRFGYRSMQHKV
ncbi:hypothetical protein AVEN_198018-1 [Araneus ventricosus]|uniref:Uncharacterized protein n=1 Tax=Araneus ventricosus TaxID=182803 RepID=A0A4Y2E7P0_ARAVE|nr:hypothetical protein AVEN_170555-1 [Araneus ventricosus]GBM24777.1 hypothetical protein AVEN_198018-1 [Araneus ventricosus]